MNNLFILDHQTDEVLDHINKKYVLFNEHEQDLPSQNNMFHFRVLGDRSYAEHLGKRNGLIVPGEDGELLEFRIFETIKDHDGRSLEVEVYALATYFDLQTSKVFDPHKTNPETAEQHVKIALDGTEWQIGNVDYKGIRTLEFDNPFNPYDYLKRIARDFELELRFYVTTDGQKVTGRYVDLVEQIGEFRGRTVEFGRDLQRIERKEDKRDIVTALWVYGPQRENGTRLKVLVEDDEARQRWGRKGKHIIDYYEPQTENQDITKERLTTLGEMELNKRINAVVSYEADIVDLENVPGMENKKIRFGDTIRIKDLKFSPPLYLEARIHNQKRDVFTKANKRVQLGDYIEYTEEEVKADYRAMLEEIRKKVSATQAEQLIEEYAEPKKIESDTPPPIVVGENPIWIDTSQELNVAHVVVGEEWKKITPTEAGEIGAPSREETIIDGEVYNGVKWDKEVGFVIERSDGLTRVVLSGSDGIKIQVKNGTNWIDVFYVDDNGNGTFGGKLSTDEDISVGRLVEVLWSDTADSGVLFKTVYDSEVATIKMTRSGNLVIENTNGHLDILPNVRIANLLEIGDGIADVIIDQGSNINGSYIRYDNGIQICWHRQSTTTNDNGNFATNWDLPASFLFANYAASTSVISSSYYNFGYTLQSTATRATFRGSGLGSSVSYTLALFAIGRWK